MARSRRAFLASVGATVTLAGCTVRPPRSAARYRLLARVVEPAADPFAFDLAVRRSVATKRRPLLLRATYENTHPAEERVEETYAWSPVRFDASRDSDVVLLDPEAPYEQASPGCWRPDTDGISALLGRLDLSDLSPGTVVRFDYAVWGTPQEENDDSCLQPGTYRVPMRAGLDAALELTVEPA